MTVLTEVFANVARESKAALLPLVGLDWSGSARDGEWTCWETGVHLADGYFAHAARIVAQPETWFVPAGVAPDEDAGPTELLQVIGACAELLRCAAISTDPATRAFHPWGASDPDGSVAMGAAEGLLHTWDICSGLGSDWRPPPELCVPVLDRLFPSAPAIDPTDALLWCSGRLDLPDRPRLTDWRWHSSVRD